MPPSVAQAFGAEIQRLRSLIASHYEHADDAHARALEFAASLVNRAQSALDANDGGGAWLQITGAIDFISASGIGSEELNLIRRQVDTLLEAA